MFYPIDQTFFIKVIEIHGFDKIPIVFSRIGYIKANLMYYLNKKFDKKNVTKLIISRDQKSSFQKHGKGNQVIIHYAHFYNLYKRLTDIITVSKSEKSLTVDYFFSKVFPRRYPKAQPTTKYQAKKLVNSLDENFIQFMNPDDVKRFQSFYETLLKKKYKSISKKKDLINSTKIKIDNITIHEIIREFRKLLDEKCSESKWGEFLEKNLYLVDSKYIKIIPELNVVLAGARLVDFGMIDSQGYLDIFEIKKPNTRVLARSKDRGNYYWSTDAIKAIVQAEKYLYNAERKAPTLAEDIKSEKNIDVKVIKPRAILLIGDSSQFGSEDMEKDFRILRMSLKNIEIVLFDELLNRLENQQNKIYSKSIV